MCKTITICAALSHNFLAFFLETKRYVMPASVFCISILLKQTWEISSGTGQSQYNRDFLNPEQPACYCLLVDLDVTSDYNRECIWHSHCVNYDKISGHESINIG